MSSSDNDKENVRTKIITMGKEFLGIPYKFGAKTGNLSVVDCSSLVQYVYGKFGITLPRKSKHQSQKGKLVAYKNIMPGDLIYFWTDKTGKGNVGHVAIYIGDGMILHAIPKRGVIESELKLRDEEIQIFYMRARRVIY